jgi:hypothetical protein
MSPPSSKDPPSEVIEIRAEIKAFLDQEAPNGKKIGASTCAVYAFFDYDQEPIYVGQTVETLRGRISRHLTGRRSDAVAKFVLDPFEVLEIEVWPLWDIPASDKKSLADKMEFAVFQKCLQESTFHAVLNEGVIHPTDPIELPPSYRARIIPDTLYQERRHPDIRLARRATTFASLARLISERSVRRPLRATLLVQARRLEALADARYQTFADEDDEAEPDTEAEE